MSKLSTYCTPPHPVRVLQMGSICIRVITPHVGKVSGFDWSEPGIASKVERLKKAFYLQGIGINSEVHTDRISFLR